VALSAFDANAKCLEAAEDQEGLVRIHVSAEVDHRAAEATIDLFFFGYDNSADHVSVAVDELGHRMQVDVGAEFEGPLQIRASECVVHADEATVRVGDVGGGANVGDLHGGVGGRLDVEQLRVRAKRGTNLSEVAGVDESGIN